jgi:hypothetical protein
MEITENTLKEMYEELLDAEGEVSVAGMKFLPSIILMECDPIAYRTGLNDYADSLERDGYIIEGYND